MSDQTPRPEVPSQSYITLASDSWISFGWTCTECHKVNYLSWNHYEVYGPVHECGRCEKAHKVKVPFK